MRKVLSFIGALVLLSNNIISPVVYADTDSSLSILLSKKVILGIIEPNIDIMSKCDINIDNIINVLDVISLKNRYLNSTVENVYARTNGLWRLDGATDTASIEMDGLGNFTMYYADGTIENTGYLECTDEYENGNFRYDMYNAENELIASFYFDSDTQFHIGNDDGSVYILDTQEDTMENSHETYWGYWGYPDGTVLEIREETWYLYENNGDGAIVVASGPVEYDEEAAYLMNEDGSSGGSKVSLDENNNLVVDSSMVLTHVS